MGNHLRKDYLPTYILCFAISITIFLLLLLPQFVMYWLTLLLIVDLLYILFKPQISFKLNIITLSWLLFLLLSFISIITTEGIYSPGNRPYFYSLFVGFINFMLLISVENWQKLIIKFIALVSSIFVMGSILQIINPQLLINIHAIIKTPEHFQSAISFINRNILTGLVFNTGPNAYVISIFMLYIYTKFFVRKKFLYKVLDTILLVISMYLLLMTGKRGFTLFVIIILFYLTYRLASNKLKAILVLITLIVLSYIFIFYTEAGQAMIQRTLLQDDITSGRMPVYEMMWEDLKLKPLFGHGTTTTNLKVSLNHGHNIYLQLLRENGLIGFITFCLPIFITLFKSDRLLAQRKDDVTKKMLSFSISLQLLFILWGVTGNPLYDVYPLLIYFVSNAISLSYMEKVKVINQNYDYNMASYGSIKMEV